MVGGGAKSAKDFFSLGTKARGFVLWTIKVMTQARAENMLLLLALKPRDNKVTGDGAKSAKECFIARATC
jgi:hypothetical protein